MKGAWPKSKTKPEHWVAWAIVHQNWKLMANPDLSHCELYDIVADPFEKTDLADQKPEIVDRLKQQVLDWKQTLPAEPSGDVFSAERAELKVPK